MEQGRFAAWGLAQRRKHDPEIRIRGKQLIAKKGQPAAGIVAGVLTKPGVLSVERAASFPSSYGRFRRREYLGEMADSARVWPSCFQFCYKCAGPLDIPPLQEVAEAYQVFG